MNRRSVYFSINIIGTIYVEIGISKLRTYLTRL